jgi:N-acyl-D-aspartate/D-glutamate deacylase
MDGDTHRSKPLPSTFAHWAEYRRLSEPLRARGRVLQGVPNLATKLNILLFGAISTGLFRRGLKTTIIALMDPKADRIAPKFAMLMSRLINTVFGADFRYQALPNPFDLWTDGLENPVMEEFGAGTAALHQRDPQSRSALLRDPAFRARFRRDWMAKWPGRAYHRRLWEARVIDCPDASCNGRSFREIAASRNADEIDTFLDLQAEHGNRLRWYTVVANDREPELERILAFPDVLMGFSDAGAHLRNMAYYNFPLRMLYRVKQAAAEGRPFMSVGRAVHRLTGEIAEWMGFEAGQLRVGARADVAIVDPAGLTAAVEEATEAEVPEVPGLRRMVRRNDAAVRQVYVAGRLAWDGRATATGFGVERGFGQVITAADGAPA